MARLSQVLASKLKEVELLIKKNEKDPNKTLRRIAETPCTLKHYFRDALKISGVSIIAEIEPQTFFASEQNKEKLIVQWARRLSKAGVAAIAILTDPHLGGSQLEDLKKVVEELSTLHPCPILHYDCVLHPYQMAQSKQMGAQAVNLTASILKDQLKEFIESASSMGMESLVQVSNIKELEYALDCGAEIIAVNASNCNSRKEAFILLEQMAPLIPKNVVKLAEYSFHNLEEIHRVHYWKYHGIIVCQMLSPKEDIESLIAQIGNII